MATETDRKCDRLVTIWYDQRAETGGTRLVPQPQATPSISLDDQQALRRTQMPLRCPRPLEQRQTCKDSQYRAR